METAGILERLLLASPLAVVGLSTDRRVRIWNRSAERIFGYTTDEVMGRSPGPIPPEEQQADDALFALLQRDGSLQDIEVKRRRKDGTILDIRVSGAVFDGRSDETIAFLFMMEDITEHKRAAERLRLSEARFRSAFDAAGHGMALVSLDGRFLRVNNAYCRLIGYSEDELLASTVPDVTHAEDRAADAAGRHRLAAGDIPVYQVEKRYIRKDGTIIWVQANGSLVRNAAGAPVHFISQIQDVTERRQAEERLQESEVRFRSAFDAAGHGIALIAPDDRILRVNAAYCRIMGYNEDEALTLTIRGITHPEDRAADAVIRARFAAGEISESHQIKRYIRKDGAIVWAQVDGTLIRDAAGAPLHFIAQVQDITEQRQAEERLWQAQKMEAVGQLTAGIAHDFNNILGTVVGNLDMASELLAVDPGAAGRHTTAAIDAALSGAELVKRLLAFSRQQPLQPKPVDIKDNIAGIVPLLRPTLGERIEITTSIAADLWPAMVDAAQVESSLLNLAINARDAMPDGGELNLHVTNASVDEGLIHAHDELKPGDYVVIAVTDTGTGIAPEVLAHVFEPFFTTKEVGAGSGLGLSMVLGTMQQLGGTARIDSELGQGTTVRLYLPRATRAETTATVSDAAPAQPTGTERILLVEDNELIRTGVETMIRSFGYTVEVVQDADAALTLWDRGERFDLVFSDIVMPGRLTGADLARALRARDPDIKVLLTSGFANPTTVQGEMEELGLELLQKPYRKAALAARLRAVLDSKNH